MYESPCCFLFMSEKNVRVIWTLVPGIPVTVEKNLCASFQSKVKPPVRCHELWVVGTRQRQSYAHGGRRLGALQSDRPMKSRQRQLF